MVGLPEAVDRSPSDRAKELVVPRILHDALNIVRNRRCLQMDIEGVASGKGQVDQGKAEMGRLPKEVRGSTRSEAGARGTEMARQEATHAEKAAYANADVGNSVGKKAGKLK
jgi:hypothetical protein